MLQNWRHTVKHTALLLRAELAQAVQQGRCALLPLIHTTLQLQPHAGATFSSEPAAKNSKLDADEDRTARYLDHSGELTFFDEPTELQLQQQAGNAAVPVTVPQPQVHPADATSSWSAVCSSSSSSSSSNSSSSSSGASEHAPTLAKLAQLGRKAKEHGTLHKVKGARQVKKTILGLQAHNQQTAQDIQQQQIRQRQELFLLQANAPEAYEALQQQQQQQQLLGDDHQVHHQQQIISDLSAQALQDYKQDLEQQKKRHIIVAKWLSELHSLWQQSEPPSEVHASQMIGSYQAALLFSTKYKEIVDDLVRQQQQVVQVTSRPAVMSRAADSPVAGSITAADSTSAVGDMAPNGSTSAVPAEGSNSCSTSAGSTAAAAAGGSTIGSTVGGRRRSTTTKTSAAASAVPPLGSRNGSSSNRSSSSGADVCASTVATWPAAKNVKAQEAVVKREFEAWHNNRAAVLRSMKVRELQGLLDAHGFSVVIKKSARAKKQFLMETLLGEESAAVMALLEYEHLGSQGKSS